MSIRIEIVRAGPLATVQDAGRPGYLGAGISASGPMDRAAFFRAGEKLRGTSGIEITTAGLAFRVMGGKTKAGFAGGAFALRINGRPADWDSTHTLANGDGIDITPGPGGNYGYVRFSADIDVPPVLGSRATNSVAGLGGHEGRALRAGDTLALRPAAPDTGLPGLPVPADTGGIRFIWGLHAQVFSAPTLTAFVENGFRISPRLDRMGVRLLDEARVFAETRVLSLVSDAIVPGDIQILGDGTPIVLMRDHQPTGGYPRIGTIISADLDRFAQLRPGAGVRFVPVTVEHARRLLRGQGRQR